MWYFGLLLCEGWGLSLLFFFFNLFFNWRLIALQNFVVLSNLNMNQPYVYIYSRLIQSPCLSFLNHIANFCCLSILHMVMWVSMLLFSYISPSPLLSSPCVHKSIFYVCFSTQFSRTVVSNSLQAHEPQQARPPRPLPTPGVHPNPCPSSQWCHPTISSSAIPFSSCLQSFPASGYFPMSQLFASGDQSIGSFSFNISPSNEHPGLISFRMDWLHLLAVQGTLKNLLQHHSSKASIFRHTAFFIVQLSHPYMTTGKTIALTRRTFVDKVISLLFNMLSRLVITFLPRSKHLLISWLQSPSTVILEPRWSPEK